MAVIKIEAKKDARSTQTICLIQGDRRTQILRFSVNRYDGGVDLMDLRWVIKTRSAAGVEDIHDPAAVEIGMTSITIDWLVDGSVTNDSGMADYELNGLDTAEDGEPIVWKGATGTISMRANIGPKFGETDGMTNIEKLILYVEDELDDVVEAGSAALDAAERANRAAGNVENISEAVENANAAAQRATDAAAAVEDLEGAVNRANIAAATATSGARSAEMAANTARSAANRADEAAKNVENIEEATVAAYQAAEDAHAAAEAANAAGLPAAMIYGLRVKGEAAKASGNPVRFLPDAGSLLRPVTVLEPQQQGSGEPSPENVRPFIGYDKLDLNAAGKNLLPNNATTQTINGVTFTVNTDGSVTANGTASGEARIILAQTGAAIYPPGSYIVTGCPTDDGSDNYMIGAYFDVDGVAMWDGEFGYGKIYTALHTMQTNNTCIIIKAGYTASNLTFYPMLRLASDADNTYKPYTGTLHTVQIGQTVYGGKFDWLTGRLRVDRKMVVLNGSEPWSAAGWPNPYTYAWWSAFPDAVEYGQEDVAELYCSHYTAKSVGEVFYDATPGVVLYASNGSLIISSPTHATVDDFKAALAASPVQIAYKLANPIEIGPFTPHIISAADPEQTNILYGDGRIEVEYVKPLHVSIEERVAAAVAAAMNAEGV